MNDVKEKINKAIGFFEKYKLALIVLVIGLVLISFPTTKKTEEKAIVTETEQMPEDQLEEKLQRVLQQIDGAGRVEVVLTVKESQQKILASDETESESRTVTVQSSDGTETVTVKSLYPVYRGALVVCDGADDQKVKLDIVTSVAALTGLGTDKITVVKMKIT
ncbi:MAG: stage III sporulation protein AG [Ruminococcaceae bacterium]|nr:stage III sporulation protein AG [Oscillospiraceae bacterium]